MKAARLHEYREHVGPESLKIEEVEEPKITGPSDVIVRVGGAGLCRTDLHIVEGQLKDLFGRTCSDQPCPTPWGTKTPDGSRRWGPRSRTSRRETP